ncbi:aspartic proteinase PCS1-like [Andrographis paniculata]|uniref:aspartic proteinase PCS1-like n=1 Tax=Andrographis paniculata TaxID=175694 RepID=UPI0021E715DF|nr:aspartic proteinase PCS1-like [Andrographis paniculata]
MESSSSSSVVLPWVIFLCGAVLVHPNPTLPANQSASLILPLKAMQIPNKLSFHHNVSLTVSVAVGSPPQRATMVLDTGSHLSWLHCAGAAAPPSSFNSGASTSYRPIPCSAPTCTNPISEFSLPVSCAAGNLCHVILSYADASAVEGSLAADTFRLDESGTTFPGTVFGCMVSGSSPNPEEDSKATGLLGMNRGRLSFVSQSGFPKFSYCISGRDSSGVLLLGAADYQWLRPLNYTPMIQITTPLPNFDKIAYTVRLQAILIAGRPLSVPESVFEPDHTGAGQTMVDSGTQFTFLLGPVYAALKSEFLNRTAGILQPVEDPNFVFQGAMDVCYRIGDISRVDLEVALPSVTVVLGGGAEIRVSGERLLYGIGGNRYCLTFGNSELLGVEAYVIGHHHQQDMWVEFDLVNSRVGLTEFSCELASRRMGLES